MEYNSNAELEKYGIVESEEKETGLMKQGIVQEKGECGGYCVWDGKGEDTGRLIIYAQR